MKYKIQGSYSLQQFSLWGSYGLLFSYANRYLLAQGMSNTEAGLLLGIVTAMAFVLQPLLTSVVDRSGLSCRGVMFLGTGLTVLSCGGLLIFTQFWPQVLLYGLACVALQVLPSFSNALGMAAIHRGERLNFSLARGFGTLSFGAGAQLAVPLMDRYGLGVIPAGTAIMCLLLLLSCIPFSHSKAQSSEENPDPIGVFFRNNKPFVLFLAAVTLLYVGHNVLCNCMYQIAVHKGDGNAQGTALLISAIAELPTMFGFALLLKWANSGKWVCVSGVFVTLRLLLSLLLPGIEGLYAAQLCQMLGYALLCISTVYYVGQTVDKRNVVKGQTYLGITNTLGSLIAHFSGGTMIDLWGVEAMMLICSAVCGAGMVLLFIAVHRQSVKERNSEKNLASTSEL